MIAVDAIKHLPLPFLGKILETGTLAPLIKRERLVLILVELLHETPIKERSSVRPGKVPRGQETVPIPIHPFEHLCQPFGLRILHARIFLKLGETNLPVVVEITTLAAVDCPPSLRKLVAGDFSVLVLVEVIENTPFSRILEVAHLFGGLELRPTDRLVLVSVVCRHEAIGMAPALTPSSAHALPVLPPLLALWSRLARGVAPGPIAFGALLLGLGRPQTHHGHQGK
jgi:hypothetical protein